MSVANAWLLAAALWLGCLRPGPWWLAGGGAALLATVGVVGRLHPDPPEHRLARAPSSYHRSLGPTPKEHRVVHPGIRERRLPPRPPVNTGCRAQAAATTGCSRSRSSPWRRPARV